MFKRGPGRPRKDEQKPVETAGPDVEPVVAEVAEKKEVRAIERKEERAQRRRRRVVGQDYRTKLGLSQEAMEKLCPEYELRWTNDVGDRLDARFNEDWDYVSWDEIGSKPGQDSMSSEGVGDRVNKVVGDGDRGHPTRAYLMKKRKEFYMEDQQAKEASIAAKEAAMFKGEHEGAGNQYIPRNIDVGIKR